MQTIIAFMIFLKVVMLGHGYGFMMAVVLYWVELFTVLLCDNSVANSSSLISQNVTVLSRPFYFLSSVVEKLEGP